MRGGSRLFPAVFTHQFDETTTAQIGLMNPFLIFDDPGKFLAMFVAYWEHHASTDCKLFHQHLGNTGGPGGDNNGVKRTFIPPTGGAVRISGQNVVITELVEQSSWR